MKNRLLLLASVALLLSTACKRKNHPPDTPSAPTGPSSGFVDTVCYLTASAIDPDEDSVRIRFSWGDGDSTSWSGLVASGAAVSMGHIWREEGIFPVQARAMGKQGATSSWSAAIPETIVPTDNTPPDTPRTPSGPRIGDPGTTFYCFWSSAADPDGDSVSLRFSWGDGDFSNWSQFVPSGCTVMASHAWQNVGTYQICAQAIDDNYVVSSWSDSVEITINPPVLKWRYDASQCVSCCPAIGADGTVYFGAGGDWGAPRFLCALNPDGTFKWNYDIDCGGSSPAVGPDGTIYVGTSCCGYYLYAMNPNGSLKWRYQTEDAVSSSPAIGSDGAVYVGSDDGYVYALNPDGTLRWRYQTERGVYSPAIGADGTVYVASDDCHLYAINPNGILKWRYEVTIDGCPEFPCFSPAISAGGTVYIGSYDGCVHALNPDGTLRWCYDSEGNRFSHSAAIGLDGTVYLGADDGCLYVLNPDGTLKWRYEQGGVDPAIGSDGTIYAVWRDLIALNPDGTLKWRYRGEDRIASPPNIGPDGTVYVGTIYDGCVYAIRGSAPLANSPWPKFHHDNRNTGRVGGP